MSTQRGVTSSSAGASDDSTAHAESYKLASKLLSTMEGQLNALNTSKSQVQSWIDAHPNKESYAQAIRDRPISTGNSSKKPKIADPFAPKRPLTAYLQWCADTKPKYKAANASMNQVELMTYMGNQWTALDSTTKSMYQERALKERTEYEMAAFEYQKQGPPSLLAVVTSSSASAAAFSTNKQIVESSLDSDTDSDSESDSDLNG